LASEPFGEFLEHGKIYGGFYAVGDFEALDDPFGIGAEVVKRGGS
jgi:hypothetical protein